MMILDGSTTARKVFWRQTIPVEPNQAYVISCWAAKFDRLNPPILCFTINGTQEGTYFVLPWEERGWQIYGIAWKSDTVEGLAARIGVDPAVLAVTVAEYNASCDSGDDPLFFKGAKYLRPLRQGPFYAINMTSSALASTGGIRVNGNLQVVDQDYRPNPGLYAAGHEASGLYGDTYNMDVPGTANGFAHTSGRVAARHVVATLQNAPAAH